MTVGKLQVLFLGQNNNMDRGKMSFGQPTDNLVTTPFLSFYIQTDDKNILFDTGMHPDNAAFCRSNGMDSVVREEERLPPSPE